MVPTLREAIEAEALSLLPDLRHPSEDEIVSRQRYREIYCAGALFAIRLLLKHEAVVGMREVLDRLPGRLHDVEFYDVDGDATCKKHCPACTAKKAIAVFNKLVKEVGGG